MKFWEQVGVGFLYVLTSFATTAVLNWAFGLDADPYHALLFAVAIAMVGKEDKQ